MAQKDKNLQELIKMVNSIFGDNVIIANNISISYIVIKINPFMLNLLFPFP